MMPTEVSQESPERDLTDASLREEREKADREMTATRAVLEKRADAVVERARENADAVLVVARDRADEKIENHPQRADPQKGQTALAQDRELEDETLRGERALADQTLQRERESRALLLTRLFPKERDATDQYLLTERARSDDALATRDDFLGMVSHDLRDLLNGIVVSAQFLTQKLETMGGGAPLLAETARIERSGTRMNRLIGDLVDIASIDAGKLAMYAVEGDLAAVITEAVDALQTTAAAKGVCLAAQDIRGPYLATFDHDRLLQVLANLIANSIKFSPQGGRISVHCKRDGESYELCVEDTGEGIPDAMLEAVFERFWQVGKSDRRGLGLGLYISQCIVKAHGGTIRAQSSLGAGTRMVFTLPAS